jgi:feruloyl esterase
MKVLGFTVLMVLMIVEAQAATCESLLAFSHPHTTVTLAQPVAAGAFSPPTAGQPGALQTAVFKELPAFCRVAAILRPVTDSEIRIEVWMPLAGWNGKFHGVGNGGHGGTINYTGRQPRAGMAEALKRGYATASTDTGHTIDTGSTFLVQPVKLVDYGYRAVHEMTVAAKAIVAAFYGAGPKWSYFHGCSGGGRQGLMEAQRFPDDYDGIIAGAPANPPTRLSVSGVHVGHAALNNPASTIPAAKFPMIHRAVLDRCDAVDGLEDGLIADPTRCSFDFTSLACRGGDSPSCLTAAQVATARTVTSPVVHPKTGEAIFPGLALGTELGWGIKIGGPAPTAVSADFVKYAVFRNADWDWRTFDLETVLAQAAPLAEVTDASADLTAFMRRGGKLLLYHGWADQYFSAQSTIDYYRKVVDATGSAQASDWLRLFLAPGMAHCSDGEGPNTFDLISALERWIENNQAPGSIVASHSTDGKLDRTRPLCPYPQVAKYNGTGSIDDAANFRCVTPVTPPMNPSLRRRPGPSRRLSSEMSSTGSRKGLQ